MSWNRSFLHAKACKVVIVCWSSGETGQVCNLSNVVLCCFTISDLQGQVWQQSRQGTWMLLRSFSNRAPVVHDRKNRCKRSLISAVILAEELCLSFVHFMYILGGMLWFSFVRASGFSLWWGSGLREKMAVLISPVPCTTWAAVSSVITCFWGTCRGSLLLVLVLELFSGYSCFSSVWTKRSTRNVRDDGEIMMACQVIVDCWPEIFHRGMVESWFKPTSWGTKLCWGFLKSLNVKSWTLCMSFSRHWQNYIYFQPTNLSGGPGTSGQFLYGLFVYLIYISVTDWCITWFWKFSNQIQFTRGGTEEERS